MKRGFYTKLLERVPRLRPEDLQPYLEALAKERTILETIIEGLAEGVLITDTQWRVRFANLAVCRLFGWRHSDVIDAALPQLVPELALPAASNVGNFIRDMEVLRPEPRLINYYVSPLRVSQDGSDLEDFVGYALVFRDLTEHRRLNAEQMESHRINALTLLAAGVAHELGNPLNSLHIHLQILERKLRQRGEKDSGALLKPLAVARDEIRRLDLIVTQFLRAIRPTQPTLRPENLNDLVEESLLFFSEEARARKLRIVEQYDGQVPQVPLDRDQIKQALYNVLKNAFQAMNDGGLLEVVTRKEDDRVLVTFRDNGVGIAGDSMQRLFEPYYSTKERGTGLGLLIVRRIIREHGGEISLQSEEDQGTEVSISLPLGVERARLLPPEPDRSGGHEDIVLES